MQLSIVLGRTNISIPPLASLANSLYNVSDSLWSAQRAALACLIVALIGSGFSAISGFPAIIFPHSRLLVYFNIMWPALGSIFAFLAASMLTTIIVGTFSVMEGLGAAIGVEVKRGNSVLLMVWLAWLLVFLSCLYWGAIWFVEVRKWSFVRRTRSEDERGHWRGIRKEVWRDLRGKKET